MSGRKFAQIYRGADSVHVDEPRAAYEPLHRVTCWEHLNSSSISKRRVVRIDIDQFGVKPRGILRWMLTPKLAGSIEAASSERCFLRCHTAFELCVFYGG